MGDSSTGVFPTAVCQSDREHPPTRGPKSDAQVKQTPGRVYRAGFLTAIAVGFDPVSVLQPVAPGAVVSGGRVVALPDTVTTLETVTPLSAVHPLPFILHAEPVPLTLGPVAPVGVPAGPRVHPDYLKAVRPGPGVLALALGSGADAVSVGFAILPPPAVSAAVVEIKPSARHSAVGLKMKEVVAAAADSGVSGTVVRGIQDRRCDEKDEPTR